MNRTTAVLSVGIAALAGAASAQPQACEPRLVGMDRRGPAQAVARTGDQLYLGAGAALHVLDVADAAAPVERGWVNLERRATDVAAWGTTVVVRDARGLDFVDVSDPAQPTVVASLDVPGGFEYPTVATMDSHAYFVADEALHVVDFSDPAHPVEVASYPAAYAADVKVRSDRAYLLADHELLVLDVSNPAAPVAIETLPTYGNRLAIAPSGGRLAVWNHPCSGHHCQVLVSFFGLANPDLPVLRSQLSFAESGSVVDVAFGGGRGYVAIGEDVAIYDLTDLSDPIELSATAAGAVQLLVASDAAFLFAAAQGRGLIVFDVSQPAQPLEVARAPTPDSTTDGYVVGSLLVTTFRNGMRTFDLSDPSRPVQLGSIDLNDGYVENVTRVGDHAYAASRSYPDDRIRIIDLSDPAAPFEVGSIPWYIDRPALDSRLLAVRDSCDEALTLYDVSDPAVPEPTTEVFVSGDCPDMDFSVVSGRLYFWDRVGGYPDYPQQLRIYDVTDPAAPALLGAADVANHTGSSVGRGRILYLAEQTALKVLDASNPSQPTVLATRPLTEAYTGGTQRQAALYGSQLAIASFVNEYDDRTLRPVHLFDVRDPASPTEIATLEPPGQGRTAAVGPGLIVVADGPAGISVYESCVPFADGFESGDASAWSASQP